jgi:hypothetical protein
MLMDRNPTLTDYAFCEEKIKECGTVKKTEQHLFETGVLDKLPEE